MALAKPYEPVALGPLDPLPELKIADLISWAAEELSYQAPVLTGSPESPEEVHYCPVCGRVIGYDEFKSTEAFARHVTKSECVRRHESRWAQMHGWQPIVVAIEPHVAPRENNVVTRRERALNTAGRWVDACKHERLPILRMRSRESAAPAWIVDAIVLYEKTPALREMMRHKYLRACASEIRAALKRTGS